MLLLSKDQPFEIVLIKLLSENLDVVVFINKNWQRFVRCMSI